MVGRYVSGTSFIKHIPLKKTGRALIYYGEMDGTSTPLAGLCDGIYAISWFDPRTGQTEKAEIQVEVRGKSCIMPKKPAAGDWVLIAECIEKTEK